MVLSRMYVGSVVCTVQMFLFFHYSRKSYLLDVSLKGQRFDDYRCKFIKVGTLVSFLDRKCFTWLIDLVLCMLTGKLFHNVVADGKTDCLQVSVLCWGTCHWSGRRLWYGLIDETSAGTFTFKQVGVFS